MIKQLNMKEKNGIYNFTGITNDIIGLKYIEFFFPKFPDEYCFDTLKIIIDGEEYLAGRSPEYFNKIQYYDKMLNFPENCTYMYSFSFKPLENIKKDFLYTDKNAEICFVFKGLKEKNLLCNFTFHSVKI